MNSNNGFTYLRIDEPEELKEMVKEIGIDSNLNIIVQLKGNFKTIISGIEFKKGLKQRVIYWEKTKANLESNLKGIEYGITRKISLLLSQSYEIINNFVTSIFEAEDEDGTNDKSNKVIKIFKYYSEKDERLFEAIVLEDKPTFIAYENGELIYTEKLIENTRTLIPFGSEDGPAKPYVFESKESLENQLRKTKGMGIADLFRIIREIVSKYVDQKPHVIDIITVDIIFSFFQDRFPTTHYLFFVGDNGVGKNVIGELFELLSYRGVKMTDPSIANIYRLLGNVEPAQCTLIMDESERIDESRDLMNIFKTGYTFGGKVAKINMNSYEQEFFNTYSFKVFLGERLPNKSKAK